MEIECSILDVELLPPPPGVNALLAYISLSDFKQADPSGSAAYVITCPQLRRDKSLAGVPE
jgi:hypothetical protein